MAQPIHERSGSLVESHKGYDPRIIFFYPVIAALLLLLIGGLAYQQLFRSDVYHGREKQQSQRRVLVPGPRGNIYDRTGKLLVGNKPRFAVTLYLDELQEEFRHEFYRIAANYRELVTSDMPDADKKEKRRVYREKQREKELPSDTQLRKIARFAVVQRYLDRINAALGRDEKVNATELDRHFSQQLLLPYILLNDLTAAEYARLIEQLPVTSPLQVYASSVRYYPYGPTAAHTLGYVGQADEPEPSDFPGAELPTFAMKGLIGRAGLEQKFESRLRGRTGGTIFRVDTAGYKVNPPLQKRLPVPGQDLITSLDVELQQAAEEAIGDQSGAAVALDVRTGEVLVLASKPDYDLNLFSPRLSHATSEDIKNRGAWINRAVQGRHPPGSTFKILTTIAAMRSGAMQPDDPCSTECTGIMMISGRRFSCHNGTSSHGFASLRLALAKSCDVYFYSFGMQTTVNTIATEARRFRMDQVTGIELPYEIKPFIPDPNWKYQARAERWFPGDTANMSIGQGFVIGTPIQMACFTASVARGETTTIPTLVHDPHRLIQRSEPIGLTRDQYRGMIEGMEQCVGPDGTGKKLSMEQYKVPGVRIAGKTGTAQVTGNLNVAWFICFAPVEKPEIAIAVMLEGDTVGEEYGGGSYAVPVAAAVMKKYFARKARLPTPGNTPAPKPKTVASAQPGEQDAGT